MKILTANRLSDGAAVWLTRDHSWATRIEAAELAADDATAEKLERAGRAAFLKNEVVDVNLIDVALEAGAVRPLRLRERIRAEGPTIRSDFRETVRPGLSAAA
jgi:hypothetical protein